MHGDDLVARREEMVRDQLAARGVRDPAVLEAMRRVPREQFISPGLRYRAYDDAPLPISSTRSVGRMTAASSIRATM